MCTERVLNWDVPLLVVHHVYDSQIAHGSSSSRVEQSVGNGIFVYLQCGSVQLPKVGLRTALSGCVYTNCTKLRGPIATCTPGVRSLDRFRMLTRPWQTIWSKRHFHTPPVRICMIPSSRSLTVPVDSVYRSCTKLGGPVTACTPGVRPLDRSSMFTRPWRTTCCKRHFRTPAVRICTALLSQTP